MVSPVSEKDFVFTWEIENFSMNPLIINEYMKSPIFMVDMGNKVKLQLFFYPRGWENEEFLSAYVNVIDYDQKLDNATTGFRFSVIGSDTSTILTDKQQYTFGQESVHVKLAFRDKILNEKNVYLPNDILTIRYQIWFSDSTTASLGFENDNIRPDEVLMSTARYELEEFKKYLSSTQCSAITHIVVKRKSIMWPIKGIRSLRPHTRLSVPVVSALADNRSFVLTFCFTKAAAEDYSAKIEIRRRESDSSEFVFVKCKITALNSDEDIKFHSNGEYFFKGNTKEDVWNFPFSILKNDLQKLMRSTNDVLYLHCEFAYSREGDVYDIGNEDVMPPQCSVPSNIKYLNTLGDSFKNAYKSGMLSDVTLRVGDRAFKAHRIILSTRSPVFEAMFENDMKEKDTGFVDITDLDPDTLDRMLAFLYSDELDVAGPEEAAELYTAADKYEVLRLKRKCSLFLQSVLSVSNVCLVLNLADLHQDDDLMDSAKDFVFRNRNELLVSECWKMLMENNVRLCASIMFSMLMGNNSSQKT